MKTSPRDRASPAASSPERSSKRARLDSLGERKLSAGARWMVEMLERMLEQYREAVMAATVIVRYQAYSKRIALRDKRIPMQLRSRLNNSWSAYDTTRRHVEWYMAQNAAYASSPSKPLPQPATTTAPALVNPEPTPLASAQVASPIPLSTASFLSYDKPPPALQLEPFRQPDAQEFLPDEMMFQSDQAMDLSSLGISELTAIINGEDYSFVDAKPDIGGGEGGAGGFGGMDQTQTRGTQAATEKLLASMNDLTQQQQQQDQGGVAGDGPQITQAIAEENVDTLLASLQSTQPPAIGNPDQNGEFNFDFQNPDPAVGDGGDGAGGEVDLSELVGLFSDPTTSSGPGQSVPAPVSLDPVPQQNLDALLADAGQEGVYGEETYDLGGIDLDDFNFGDGSIPNVEGDEFEELFAEFK